MSSAEYPKHGLRSSGEEFTLRLSSEKFLTYGDYAAILADIEAIFEISAKETRARTTANSKRTGRSALVVRSFQAGSLEIISDPYFAGVVTGAVANAVYDIFVHVLQRINGKPADPNKNILDQAAAKADIPVDRVKAAATKAVSATTTHRKRLREMKQTFGLSITIRRGREEYVVTDD